MTRVELVTDYSTSEDKLERGVRELVRIGHELSGELTRPVKWAIWLGCAQFSRADELRGEDNGMLYHDPEDQWGTMGPLCACHHDEPQGLMPREIDCLNPTVRPVVDSPHVRLYLCCRCAEEFEGLKHEIAAEWCGTPKYGRPSETAMENAERYIVARALVTLRKHGEQPILTENPTQLFRPGETR